METHKGGQIFGHTNKHIVHISFLDKVNLKVIDIKYYEQYSLYSGTKTEVLVQPCSPSDYMVK